MVNLEGPHFNFLQCFYTHEDPPLLDQIHDLSKNSQVCKQPVDSNPNTPIRL